METQIQSEAPGQRRMLPPAPGTFRDREDLVGYVRDFGATQGYVVTIRKSKRDKEVILGCDRGGVYRNRRNIDEMKRRRKATSRLINCPFEAIGKKDDDVWVLTVKNGEHNHEPLKDMAEHPSWRRFSGEEIRQIKLMTEAGIKPLEVLKALKKNNPDLQSMPRDLYNVVAKIRQGNLSEKSFKSWRPNRSLAENVAPPTTLYRITTPVKLSNFIGGKFVDSRVSSVIDVINPATQEVVSQVPLTTYDEFKAATNAAKQAFPSWRNTPLMTRQRIMFKLQELIRRDIEKLATSITTEQGKALKVARGDVLCSLEIVEEACGMANVQMSDILPNICNNIDRLCIREPLGVCAGICSFNFSAIAPLWMFPIAVTCGNTFVLKPCEKNPGASMILAELAKEAGIPDGVLNVVHGSNELFDYIYDDEDIKAISFIGSNTNGMHIYERAAASGKRVQCNIGSRNYVVVMSDANKDATLNGLIAAGFGAAGQMCMTPSTVIFVGGSVPWEREVVERARALKVNVGTDPAADLGPVMSKQDKDQICRLVQSGVQNGARLILDGTNFAISGYERGNFVGPTILCDVTTGMECYKEEIFGPLLLCVQVNNLEEAIGIVNRDRPGNGTSIFTSSFVAARKFQNEVENGLVGINVPVPVQLQHSSYGGPRSSFIGNLNFSARAGLEFYTQVKIVAQQWTDFPSLGVPTSLPLLSRKDTSSQGTCPVLLTADEPELPNQRASSDTHTESERNSSSQATAPLALTSGTELPDREVSSVPLTSNTIFPSPEMSLTSENGRVQLQKSATVLAYDMNLPHPSVSLAVPAITERTYLPSASHWNGNYPASQESRSAAPTSEKNYMPMSSGNQKFDTATMPPKNDNPNSTSQRVDWTVPAFHCSDMHVQPASEGEHMRTTPQSSNTMVQTFRPKADMTLPTERTCMPSLAHQNDHTSSSSSQY